MPTPDPWFESELKRISPDLRLNWGRENYGWNCWVVERRVPNGEWRRIYEDAINQKQQRFVQQKLSDGTSRYYDTMPEWIGVHFVKTPDNQYRSPDGRDLAAIRRWLFEFRSIDEQNRHDKERRDEIERKAEETRLDRIAYETANNRHWIDPISGQDESDPFSGQPATVREGSQW